MKLSFEEFVSNVQSWAKDRGIYEHSTGYAQMLKAISEFGEVCDGIAKKRPEDIKDGLGDTVTCLINAAWFFKVDIEPSWISSPASMASMSESDTICEILESLALFTSIQRWEDCILGSISYLNHLANLHNIDMEEAYFSVWEIISKRKGKMVEGGVFVKESDL